MNRKADNRLNLPYIVFMNMILKTSWLFASLIIGVIVMILVIIGGWFYWFQWRPAEARRKCSIEAAKVEGSNSNIYNFRAMYDVVLSHCLSKRGLK